MKAKKIFGGLLLAIIIIMSFVATGYLMYFWGNVVYDTMFTSRRYSTSLLGWIVMIWLTLLSFETTYGLLKTIITVFKPKKG